ncbi:amidohydrolase [Corynebacterium sp. zg912]|uniref:Carbon-nitrogen hydrolase family protein n=1 Tax=Corynebacterium wankanglinii TaxID=2735136 RepID=A0A7V8UV44_9CORY|nr:MULTISPECIES: carbon-nitrogen hydrolase family protein [Corynebacterium]MBA1837850.1 carbon-nitrogen hydrolase family protein [Corynebacterium wankanglinii]MCR5929045.1 amidohydrolase [Corynebacterium sp. zg912]
MKIALLQIASGGDKMSNLAMITPLIRDAAAKGATLIVLPEGASQAFEQGRLDTQAEDLDGPFATALRRLAGELGVTVVAGMFRPADKSTVDGKELNRVYNTALITGDGVHKGYDKIHTYDAFSYKESDTVRPGEELVTFVHEGVTVGVATCFDIRFPEQFQQLAERGARVIVVPTSWADGDGKVEQWRVLTVARALDTGVFIAAAGQARPDYETKAGEPSGPTGAGHSVVVGPTGLRLAEAGYGPETLVVDIDPEDTAEAQRQLPLAAMRKRSVMR